MTTPAPPEILGLLGDPLRWQLMVELGRSDRRVSELVELVGKRQNLVSYHLSELRRARIVSARRSSADGRDVYYRADLLRCRDLLSEAGPYLHPALTLAPTLGGGEVIRLQGKPRLLFLCTGNSARSQIAEALAVHRSAGTVKAYSAGSRPKPLHPHAVRVMAERGIDSSHRTTKPITRFSRSRLDRVITLCDKVREICPDFPGPPIATHWSIADPAAGSSGDGGTYKAFRRVADEIEIRVDLLLSDMRSQTLERSPS